MKRGHTPFFAEKIQNETIKGRCYGEYLDPRGMDPCDTEIDIRGGRFYHSRYRLRIFVLAGLAFRIFDFGGIAVGITLAMDGWQFHWGLPSVDGRYLSGIPSIISSKQA